MSVNYQSGLEFSLIAAGVLGVVFAVLVVWWGKLTSYHLVAAFLTLCVAALAPFAVIYPVVNLFLQPRGFPLLGSGELETGALGLRVSSVFLGVSAVFQLERIVKRLFRGGRVRPIDWQILAQFAVYLPALALLWAAMITGIRSAEISILNWAFFFIMDDWLILKHYMSAGTGPGPGPGLELPRAHRMRLLGFNFLLLGLLMYSTGRHFGVAAALGTTAGLIFLIWVRYQPRRFFVEKKRRPKQLPLPIRRLPVHSDHRDIYRR